MTVREMIAATFPDLLGSFDHGQPQATAATNTAIGTSNVMNRKPLRSLHVNSTTPKKRVAQQQQPSLREVDKLEKQITNTPTPSTYSSSTKTILETIKSPSSENPISSAPRRECFTEKVEGTSSNDQQQQSLSDVFRMNVWIEPASDEEDMWTLKRASPVYDSDDEFYQYESPVKRKKTVSLDAEDRLSEDDIHSLLGFAEDLVSTSATI
ncbi:hypothetical protein ACA910_008184 [Epithemia clementina (nom. ined.)]